MWPDGVGLKHHANVTLIQGTVDARVGIEECQAPELDNTPVGLFQPSNAAQRGRLATAAGPQQGEKGSAFKPKGNLVDACPDTVFGAGVLLGQPLNDQRVT